MNKSDKDFLLYVISGNYNEFVGYALAHSLPPHKLVYVDDPRKLRGVRVENYVYVGTYYKRNDINKINDMLACSYKNAMLKEVTDFNKWWKEEFNDLM